MLDQCWSGVGLGTGKLRREHHHSHEDGRLHGGWGLVGPSHHDHPAGLSVCLFQVVYVLDPKLIQLQAEVQVVCVSDCLRVGVSS